MNMNMPDYVEHIGRMAHVLVPIAKIDYEIAEGTVRSRLYRHFEAAYGGFTEQPLVRGMWKGFREAHVQMTISFKGKEQIPGFLEFLSSLCRDMDEECLYLEMGEDSFLVRPSGGSVEQTH